MEADKGEETQEKAENSHWSRSLEPTLIWKGRKKEEKEKWKWSRTKRHKIISVENFLTIPRKSPFVKNQ